MIGEDEAKIEIKKICCWPSPGCHDICGLLAYVKGDRIVKITGNPKYPTTSTHIAKIGQGCSDRMTHFLEWLYHPGQLMHPLKRVGERGENKWKRISWEQALDEIAEKLKELKAEHGAETLAVIEGTYRTDLYPIRARFLNLFGNPQNVGDPGTICLCNRMALWYALTGTAGLGHDTNTARCFVISGWNISESMPKKWREIKKRLENKDVKLVVIDPRRIEAAEHADLWLQIRPGTDAALYLAWVKVIIDEELYNKDFVDKWTFGFDQLKKRAAEYTLERVAEITWIPAEEIRESARMYATNQPAIFNFGRWGVASDHIGLNATRTEQARLCLRVITTTEDGEKWLGPGPIINGRIGVRDSMLQLEDKCPPEQRKKQLGADKFKLMTWPAYEIVNKYYREHYGLPLCMSGHNFLSPAPLIYRAILSGNPYPVKALLTWTSNPMVNSANTKLVYQALKSPNLALHVVLEHFMTPTALLADYVLPAASKLEKLMFSAYEDFGPAFICGERAIKPLGERRSDYDVFHELAIRLGFGEYFPWKDEEELAEYRLKPLGITFKEAATERYVINSEKPWTCDTLNPRTGKPTGFATPSGKIELYSNVLGELGYDPLPFYEEPAESPIRTPEVAGDYPFILTTGGRYRPYFHSENRQPGIGMREQHPDPLVDIHPDTAREMDIRDGDWVYIETRRGAIKQKARLNPGIHPGVINVEGLWWFPEQPPQEPSLHGVWQSNANVLTMDDPDNCDPLTGGWTLRALLCKVYKDRGSS